jgi:serine/threonine protein phosphatase PrpC
LKREGWSLSTYKDFIKSKLSDVIEKFLTDDAQNLARRMVNNALSEKSEDNITVTTCHFSGKSLKAKTAGICGGIFDGHGKHGRLISRRCMKILSRDLKKEQKLCSKSKIPSTTTTITSSKKINLPREAGYYGEGSGYIRW